MKFLDRLGLFIFSFIILVLSILVGLIGFKIIDCSIFTILLSKVLENQQYLYILYGVCGFLILLSIKCLFFPSSNKKAQDASYTGIMLENEDGKLLITNETLESIVQGVVNDLHEIIAARSKITLTKRNEVIIHTEIDVEENTIIKLVTSKLQMGIKEAIKDATDIDVKEVNVRVKKVENQEGTDKPKSVANPHHNDVVLEEEPEETTKEEVEETKTESEEEMDAKLIDEINKEAKNTNENNSKSKSNKPKSKKSSTKSKNK